MSSPITNWWFSLPGVGNVTEYDSEFSYAGGLAIVGFGSDGPTTFQVFNLGNSEIALMVTLNDANNQPVNLYWNSHYATPNTENDSGMVLWQYISEDNNYYSTSIGPEQTFKLVNLGNGNVALQATAGAFPGQYLSGRQGGWYPDQWSMGTGSFLAVPQPAALQVNGDMLPILIITNSGYELNLSGRDLSGLNLANANMQGCNLSSAVLSGIVGLENADFTGANLRSANLNGLSLAGANWSKADFTGTNLSGVKTAASANMAGAIFDGANLTGVNFSGASLAGTSFVGANLTAVNFSEADLSGANLTSATLEGVSLQNANLQGTHFDHADLSTAQFSPQPNFSRSTTNRTTFVGATLPFSVISNNWSWLDLTEANIGGIPSAIPNLVADEALLPSGLNLQKIDLSGASFVGTQMYEIQLQQANLQSANLSNALLKGARLDSANLTQANLDSAYLIAEQAVSGDLQDPTKLESAVAINAFMFNTVLDGAHCDGVDFSGAILVTASSLGAGQASAIGASMNFAKFNQAAVVLAVFDGAQLSAADFSSASMVGASFQDNGSNATQLTPSSDVTHTDASVYQADIRGANFTGANMDGLNMKEAIFSTAPKTEFQNIYAGYGGQKVPVAFNYGPTVLGNTTSQTICPNGDNGPCTL